MEISVKFKSDDHLTLEGLWNPVSKQEAVAICHPHPLYGGDMHNPVVGAVAEAYVAKGISTLRFNFRGVGRSSGSYGEGIGEQQDLQAAVNFLDEMGITIIRLAGYSFGAYITALVAGSIITGAHLVMIAPPVAFVEFPVRLALPRLGLVIAGENDDLAPPKMLQTQVTEWNSSAKLIILPKTDHFLFNALPQLRRVISAEL